MGSLRVKIRGSGTGAACCLRVKVVRLRYWSNTVVTSVVGIVWVWGAQVLPEDRFASTVQRESHLVGVPVSWELVWDGTTGCRKDAFGSCTG